MLQRTRIGMSNVEQGMSNVEGKRNMESSDDGPSGIPHFVIRSSLFDIRHSLRHKGRHESEFVVPLTEDGHLDSEEWRTAKNRCTVRRFWEGEEDWVGEVHHTRHRTWAFSYAPGEEDDEPFFHLESHVLRVGEYVSITEQDGETRTFRVVYVE